jgi:hypothetical protein
VGSLIFGVCCMLAEVLAVCGFGGVGAHGLGMEY